MTYANFVERYRDKAYIGSGGFAKVYKVFDFANNYYVALKVADVRPELRQFTLQYEVELVNQLPVHPNIVKYESCYRFNTGIAGEMDFAILPYYENGNLEQFLSKQEISGLEKKQIIRGILHGIHFLHNNNIIHRDLKAQNILMQRANGIWIPKIADFGLGRKVDGYDSAVSNSSIGVSFEYAAPEQIKNAKIYKNVDLWAVGAIIFRIIAGISPFRTNAEQDVKNIQSQLEISRRIMALDFAEAYHSIPSPYREIIDKCLVLDAKNRVRDAGELLSMLDNVTYESNSIEAPFHDNDKTELIAAEKMHSPIDEPPPIPLTKLEEGNVDDGKTELIQDKTELINPTVPPRPQPKQNFQYEPLKNFEMPDYGGPRKNLTQIFTPPPVSKQEPPATPLEHRIKMSDSADGINKLWIYIPVFTLLIMGVVWALYGWLNPEATPIIENNSSDGLTTTSSSVPQSFLTCFENGKNNLGGTFELIPSAAFLSTFESLDGTCYTRICHGLNDGNIGRSTFYNLAENGNNCFAPLLKTSLAYHHRMIRASASIPIFYNSGQYELSIPQKNELNAFLKKYKNLTDQYALLIIGRASKIGSASANMNLSRNRAESIIDFVNNHYVKNLKTSFVYFGADPPQLTKSIANQYGIRQSKYRRIKYGRGADADFSLRLNQSVMLVMYDKKQDPFDLEE